MSTQVLNAVPPLSKNQRNLYRYYLAHVKRHPRTPCYVPKNPMTSMNNEPGMTKLQAYIKIIDSLENLNLAYIKIIDSLENLNLIRTDRSADNYTGWIILPPNKI
jgi:hypothetical protein